MADATGFRYPASPVVEELPFHPRLHRFGFRALKNPPIPIQVPSSNILFTDSLQATGVVLRTRRPTREKGLRRPRSYRRGRAPLKAAFRRKPQKPALERRRCSGTHCLECSERIASPSRHVAGGLLVLSVKKAKDDHQRGLQHGSTRSPSSSGPAGSADRPMRW